MKYIIRKRALGDVLWIEPIVRTLAAKNKKLIVYTKYNELFDNYPFKNVHFKTPSTIEKIVIHLESLLGVSLITLNLDNSYEVKPDIHFLHAYQTAAKLPIIDDYPKLYLSSKEKTQRIIEGDYVVLHIESFSDKRYRQVYGIDWNTVINFLNSKGYKVVQAGINNQKFDNSLSIKTNIRELISLIYNSKYFIGLDSGPSHIAASLKIPSVIFFGAIKPELRHFPNLFNGILLKKECEYDNQNLRVDKEALPCNFANENGDPKCCTYTTENVLNIIEELFKRNVTKAHN